jgi:hypothetical protein
MAAPEIACMICKARFRVSDTHPEMTASDALRHVVREHGVSRADAHEHLTGVASALIRRALGSRMDQK